MCIIPNKSPPILIWKLIIYDPVLDLKGDIEVDPFQAGKYESGLYL
jgi:hypothetical protein